MLFYLCSRHFPSDFVPRRTRFPFNTFLICSGTFLIFVIITSFVISLFSVFLSGTRIKSFLYPHQRQRKHHATWKLLECLSTSMLGEGNSVRILLGKVEKASTTAVEVHNNNEMKSGIRIRNGSKSKIVFSSPSNRMMELMVFSFSHLGRIS